MAIAYVIVALVSAAIAVFAFQNGTQVSVRFLLWTLPTASVAAVTMLALGAGVVIVGVPLWIRSWRLGSRVSVLEARVRQLETALADRERALLAARPPRSTP